MFENWKQLASEDPEIAAIEVEKIEETEEAELAERYDYYYVPTIYVGETKLHEGAFDPEKYGVISEKEALSKVLHSI